MSESSLTIATIPPEVLEHIAYFVATPELKGPPSDLASLCCSCKLIHTSLSFSGNPSLYAAIFRFKFDVAAPMRRLGPECTTAQCLAAELRKRFEGMKRIRAGIGSRASAPGSRESDLWMAIFMMLENDGKNALQLKQFALVEQWLLEFFLGHSGGSFASYDMYSKTWPRDNADNKLAMWLLWLCDVDEDRDGSSTVRRSYCEVLRAYALGANKYALTQHSWTHFSHGNAFALPASQRQAYVHYGHSLTPAAPPICIPAILGYISRIKEPGNTLSSRPPRAASSHEEFNGNSSTDISMSQRWDCDWERCIEPGLDEKYLNGLDRFYRPGTLEGAWEGLFTYTEFSVYAAILSGGPPQLLHDGAIGQHPQVWKLREYNYLSSLPATFPLQGCLPSGDPLNAFFPHALLEEENDRVIFTHASKEFIYSRVRRPAQDAVEIPSTDKRLRDVVVFGEGHSSWGDFRLRGRVRASDAFVTILKQYNGPDDRGRWLYRGYLVGGRLTGRWRDVLSPLRLDGYEGSFELSHRG